MTELAPSTWSPALSELMGVLDRTQDPNEQQKAFLRFYGCYAQANAEYFLADLLAAGTLKPEDDLGALAQNAVERLLQVLFAHNEHFDFPEFVDATRKTVEVLFYQKLNAQLALAITPPVGSA